MKNSNAIFAFVVAALLAFSFGCAGKSLPGVKDTHGCIASAGYTWCKESGKCIRIWEENCTAPLFGSDRDAYGCIPSAGYSWCPELSSCVRTWETPCASKPGVRVLSENFPPFNFEAGNGTVAGRSAEIVRFMLTKMGQVAQIEVMGWPEAYQLALSQPNVALFSAARNPSRESLFKWVGPIGTYDKTLYARSGSALKLNSLEDAAKAASICVVQYDDREQMLMGLGFTNLVSKASDDECLKALAGGSVELWFGSADTLPYAAAKARVAQSAVIPAFHVEDTELYVIFSKSTPDSTVQSWQSALDSMKRDGAFGIITDSWVPTMAAGADRDSHGCIGSAGYAWCPELSKCVRTWEEGCPSLRAAALEEQAQTHCAPGSTVYTCGEYIRVVSDMPGAGSKFYRLGDYGEPTVCPLVAPDAMSQQCSLLLLGNNCVEKEVDCTSAYPPLAITDLRDDPSFVGAQLTWSKPGPSAVDYSVYRGDEALSTVSFLGTIGKTSYNDVFDGKNKTFAYFVRVRNAAGTESQNSNIVYVQQLSTANRPSPGQIG